MRKHTKLYNVLFPFWLILLMPTTWIIVLPGNSLIDSLVFFISAAALRLSDRKRLYKKHILKIFFFGLLSDAIGSIYILILSLGFSVGTMGDELYLTIPALIISAILIFTLNYKFTFKHLDKKTRLKLALIYAVVTTPYTFLVPTSLMM